MKTLKRTAESLPDIRVPEGVRSGVYKHRENQGDMSLNSQEEYLKGLNRRKFVKTEFLRNTKKIDE